MSAKRSRTPARPTHRRRAAACALAAISLSTTLLVSAAPPGEAGTPDRARSSTLEPRPGERLGNAAGLAVAWPAPRVAIRSGHAVRGLVSVPVAAATATLQRLVVGVWVDVISTPVAPSGSFVLPLPSFYFGHFTYRLRVTAAGAEPLETAALPVTVVPDYAPRGRASSYALISSNPVGRWDPCTPIDYKVNLAQARRGALVDVQTALGRIAQATGLQFVYRGTTSAVPFAGEGLFDPAVADLVVAWADPDSVPGLFGPGTYGMGGLRAGTGYDAAGKPVRPVSQGGVTFNSDFNSVLQPGSGEGYSRVAALMHELGHAVGLFHVEGDGAQIMSPSLSRGRDQWGAGDLAGLEAVGAAQGCITPQPQARGNRGDEQVVVTRD